VPAASDSQKQLQQMRQHVAQPNVEHSTFELVMCQEVSSTARVLHVPAASDSQEQLQQVRQHVARQICSAHEYIASGLSTGHLASCWHDANRSSAKQACRRYQLPGPAKAAALHQK
jgi:hypothetical protein